MQFLERAEAIIKANSYFKVFPLGAMSKLPAIKNYAQEATRDPAKLAYWNKKFPDGNVGIPTDELLVVDSDNKGTKKGRDEILRLDSEGKHLPETFEQLTPTNGNHFFYHPDSPVRQGVDVLGRGLDIRAKGGYVVGFGSKLPNGIYSAIPRPIRSAPEWLVDECKRAREAAPPATPEQLALIEPARAIERAIRYLLTEAPIATSGENGDQCTFAVAAKLKDIGCDAGTAAFLLLEHWNDRCIPPWTPEDIDHKVANAFKYGKNPAGIDAPEIQFASVTSEPKPPDEIDKLNKDHAYIAGNSGFVIHETKNEKDKPFVEVIDLTTFHTNEAAKTYGEGKNIQPLTRAWIKSPRRRTYQKLVFSPERKVPDNFYNLWKGFTVTPLDVAPTPRAEKAFQAFMSHVKENICCGSEELTTWLLAYFGHMIQKPWELPLVSIALRGKKGVGKNAFIDRLGYFLGASYTTLSNRKNLSSNFNAILENKVMVVLDEAFWSGDKQNEGVLKAWVTAPEHVIERKGHEHYPVANCMRLIILANDDWVVPASPDERRFAVFDVGEGKMQNTHFFREMREGMEADNANGYRLLLKYLKELDISPFTVGVAPNTQGLLIQKHQTLSPLIRWWYDCLQVGEILGSDFTGGWPESIKGDSLRKALNSELQERNIRTRIPSSVGTTAELKMLCPSLYSKVKRVENDVGRYYQLPPLAQARKEWEKYIGHEEEWESEDEDLFS